MKKFYIILILCVCACKVFSANVINTTIKNTVDVNSIDVSSKIKANDWGLTVSEWNQYLSLMRGPNGLYYKNLTPVEVLGINADDSQDLYHFAEIYAKQEHDKVGRELRFNIAFNEAVKRLYSDEPIIKPFDLSPYGSDFKK